MNHDYDLHEVIIQTAKDVTEALTEIRSIKETLKEQEPLIESWKFAKQNAIFISSIFIFTIGIIANMFQGCLNYLIHK